MCVCVRMGVCVYVHAPGDWSEGGRSSRSDGIAGQECLLLVLERLCTTPRAFQKPSQLSMQKEKHNSDWHADSIQQEQPGSVKLTICLRPDCRS